MSAPLPEGVRVAVGLGSNLGDRLAHLRTGVAAMRPALRGLRASSVYASRPQGVEEPQPDYLNAVLVGVTGLAPAEILSSARDAEAEAGRERPRSGAPRTLDVDILLYGDRTVNQEGLRIPHPRWKERAFVLAPLSEVAPDWPDPEGGGTVTEIWNERSSELEPVRIVGSPSALLELVDQP